MAGGNDALHITRDPAIERWATTREKTIQHFKFTPKNVRNIVLFAVAVPVIIYELGVADAKSMYAKGQRTAPPMPSLFSSSSTSSADEHH
eukprot:m.434418 g.434418  ORF g.434418 m.434418 type:complete len:90 (+) comp17710_c0_seq1:30-299(+)